MYMRLTTLHTEHRYIRYTTLYTLYKTSVYCKYQADSISSRASCTVHIETIPYTRQNGTVQYSIETIQYTRQNGTVQYSIETIQYTRQNGTVHQMN